MDNVVLMVSETMKTTLKAAGVNPTATGVPPCDLHVGDVIMYPGPTALALKVVSRMLSPAREGRAATWYLEMAPVPHPLAGPLSIELPRA